MNEHFTHLIRTQRRVQNMRQEDLGQAVGKSRHWVIRLESGDERVVVTPDMAIKLALVLGLDPIEVLRAADIPQQEWPNYSYTGSNSANLNVVDLSELSGTQATLVRQLVDELKAGNNTNDSRP